MTTIPMLRASFALGAILIAQIPLETRAQDAEDDKALDEIVVTGTKFYDNFSSSGASKLSIPLIETPQSLSVINDDLIETFSITQVDNLYKYVAGLDQRSKGSQGELFNGGATARGFDLDVLDGFKLNGISFIPVQPVDTIAIERAEFLKGPSGIVFGRNNYGGAVNFVTKQPENTQSTYMGASVGNYDHYRFEADVNMPIVDETLLVRLPVAYEATDGYLEDDSRQFTAVPSLKYQISDRLTFDLIGIIQDWRSKRQLGVPALALGATFDDINWLSGDGTPNCNVLNCTAPPESIADVLFSPPYQNYTGELTQSVAKLTYALNDSWSILVTGSRLDSSFLTDQYLIGGPIAELTGDAFFLSFVEDRETESSYVEVGLSGEFMAFGRSHQLYVGADYRTFESTRFISSDRFITRVPVLSFSGRNDFRDWLDENDIARPDFPPFDTKRVLDREYLGFNIQTHLEIVENVKLLIGGRFEDATLKNDIDEIGPLGFTFNDEFDDSQFMPRAGLTWLVLPDMWSVYASYTEGYDQQTGLTRSGGEIGAETGEQIELGVKGQLFEDRLLVSLAVFRIDRENVAVDDPDNGPNEEFVIPGLTQRNQGIELEIVGEPLNGLNVIFAGNVIDAEFGESINEFLSETEVASVPDYTISAYANYDVLAGPLAGLSVGGGVSHVGRQWADSGESYRLDGYTTVDLNVGYTFNDRHKIQLSLQNAFDERFFVSRGDFDGCCGSFGDGRIIRASISTRFDQ